MQLAFAITSLMELADFANWVKHDQRNSVNKQATIPPTEPATRPSRGIQSFLKDLGPGLVTGAADDDPSGISTYSVAGASYGYGTLWTALLSFPLMAVIQLMCARLGMVTGCGLASIIRKHYPRWFYGLPVP